MTLGVLTAAAVGVGVTVATGGLAAGGAALGVSAATTLVETGGAVAAATGAISTGTAGLATAATGAALTGTVTGAVTAGGSFTSAATAGAAAGAVGGPAGAFLLCFSEEMQVLLRDKSHSERVVRVADLQVGDEVLSIPNIKESVSSRCYHKVTNATVIEGNFPAHDIKLANGKTLVATSPHYVITFDKSGNSHVVTAADVKVGDMMQCADSMFAMVERIDNVSLKKKVNIEVESGMLFVNQVLTSGVCEYGPPKKSFDAASFFTEYRATHASKHKEAECFELDLSIE